MENTIYLERVVVMQTGIRSMIRRLGWQVSPTTFKAIERQQEDALVEEILQTIRRGRLQGTQEAIIAYAEKNLPTHWSQASHPSIFQKDDADLPALMDRDYLNDRVHEVTKRVMAHPSQK